MSRELMPKSGIMMPHVVVNRDAAVVGVSTVDGVAGAVDLTGKYLQKTDAEATYQTKTEGASKDYVLDSIQPIMEGALFKADPFVDNNIPFRSAGANGVESVDMIKVTPENSIKLGSYESSVQGVEIHSAGRVVVVDQNDSGVETKYPVYSKRYRPEIEDLPFAAIGSYVKDSKGRTIGVNRTGINSDIKQFTQKVAFQQPVTIADGVGDYDAVTMRQLRNSGGGSGGPTMSGISNFGVGQSIPWDSRAYIPPYALPKDGQLVNRADWPELWEHAQQHGAIDDSVWIADVTKRGSYSKGDGTTTFRLPDWNGVQKNGVNGFTGADSIPANFFRGGVSPEDMIIKKNAAPNITGRTGLVLTSQSTNSSGSLVDNWSDFWSSAQPGGTSSDVYRENSLGIDASRSSDSYGRNSTTEVYPNHVSGVWIVRASGGFTAANTSWSVINSDTTEPSTGVTVNGGKVESQYKNPTLTQYARLYSSSVWGSPNAAVIEAEGSAKHSYKFYDDGTVDFRQSGKTNPFRMYTPIGTWSGISDASMNDLTTNGMDRIANDIASDTVIRGYSIGAQRSDGFPTKVGYHMYMPGSPNFGSACITLGGDNNHFCRYFLDIDGQIGGSTNYSNFNYTKNAVSDARVKHGIYPVGVAKSYSNIQGLEFVEFIYDNDEQERVRHGVIAQQAETVEPLYVKTRKYVGTNPGEVVEQKELDTTPMLLDTMHVVQTLMEQIDTLKAEIAELKSNK